MSEYRYMDFKTLLHCFARCYLVGAAFNTRGMQNIGLVFALEPGLRRIYPDPRARQAARKRYLKHYNTHLFWTPLLVGVFISLEDKIAKGLFTSTVLEGVKNTTVYTLSAIGDSVFAGSLLVFWSLSTTGMVLAGWMEAAYAWLAIWFVALHVFKFCTFMLGYREGLKFLLRLKQWNLINWGQRLKLLNAMLLTWLLYLVWPGEDTGAIWAVGVGGLALGGWLISRTALSREIVALLVLALYTGAPLFSWVW